MNGSVAAVLVQRKLGFRSDQQTAIIEKMTEACRLLERGRTLPKFLIEEDASLALTAAVNYVALPSGFLRIVDDDHPYYTNSDGGTTYLVGPEDWDEVRKRYIEAENGPPQAFSIRETRLYVMPAPAEATTLTWSYYKASDDVAVGTENIWLLNAPYLIIGKAGLSMAEDLHADAAQRFFSNMVSEWNAAIFAEAIEHETNGPVIMGSAYVGG